jgi:HK97 family phage portal protein
MGMLGKFFNRGYVRLTGTYDWQTPVVSSSGEVVTAHNALNLAAIYSCVNVKANAIAKLPLGVFQKTDNGRVKVVNHPVQRLLETRPNPYMTPFLFKHTMEVHRNLYGVAYIKQEFDKYGRPVALYLMYPPYVTVAEDLDGKKFYIETLPGVENTTVYDETEILRLPYLTIDGFEPKSPITVARETIGTLKQQQKFLGSFYSNGTLTRGILRIPSQLNKDAKEKVRQAWQEANSGTDNASKIAILDSGIEFQNITIPLQDAEFIASQKFGIEEIARIFNVPLHMINSLENATFSNIEQQSLDFFVNTIAPELVAMEEEMNFKLFTTLEADGGYYVKFNMASALRGDSTARANYYKTMVEMGVYSINEVRELEEKDRIDNGDNHFISLNFTTLNNLENYQNGKNAAAMTATQPNQNGQ